jgi:hypothetical protein
MNVDTNEATYSYPEIVRFSRRTFRNFSASQLVWAKLERTAARAELLCAMSNPADQVHAGIFRECHAKLRLARECLDRPIRRTWAFWELIHRVDELLLLVTPDEMLAAEAIDVCARFDQKIKDPALRKAWMGADDRSGPLPAMIRRLPVVTFPGTDATSTPQRGPPPADGRRDRHALREALKLVNEQGDTNFWRLGSNVSVQLLSALLLVLLAIAFWYSQSHKLDISIRVAIFGAGGALVSNMISTKPLIVSIGATSRYFAYALFVKPVIGAFAAGFAYLLELSDFLNIPGGNEHLRLVVALAAGFAGEWLLRPMMDKVLRTLSAKSDKVTTAVPSKPALAAASS